MKFEINRVSSEVYFDFIKSMLLDYDENSGINIFKYLCENIQDEINAALVKITDSVNMMEFYFISKNLEKDRIKRNVDEYIIIYRDKIQNFIFDDIYSSKATKKYLFFLDLWKKKSIVSELLNFMNQHGKLSETANVFIRKTLIDSIIYIGHFLNKIGIMNQLVKTANYYNYSNHLSKLVFELGYSEEVSALDIYDYHLDYGVIKEPKTVMEVFTYDYLHTLSFSHLIFINLFWVNKMAKSYENILAFMIMLYGNDKLLLDIKNENTDFNMFKDKMKNASKINYDKVLEFLRDLYEDDLLMSDLRILLPIYETLSTIYAHKNFCIFSALENEIGKEIKNYGVVKETINDKMIAFMWDLPRYNLPISVHFSKDSLIYYLQEVKKQERIREYMCNDFFGKNNLDNMPNAILYPISKKDSEYLINKSKISNRLAHIAFLQNGKWPDHFKNSKGKIEKRYITIKELE